MEEEEEEEDEEQEDYTNLAHSVHQQNTTHSLLKLLSKRHQFQFQQTRKSKISPKM